MRIGGTDFDRQLSLGVVMPLFGFGSAMKRAGLDVPSSYFHDLATWSNINRMYEPRVIADIRQVRHEASEPELLDRLVRVVDEQRGHTLAMEVEEAKIALSDSARGGHSAGMGRAGPQRRHRPSRSRQPHQAIGRAHRGPHQELPRRRRGCPPTTSTPCS